MVLPNTESLTVTTKINSQKIADLSWAAFDAKPLLVQEILLQSKSEQTFTGMLANQIEQHEEFCFQETSGEYAGSVLLEFKGTDYQKNENGKVKQSRNFHDLSVVNQDGELEIIIENKFWYHFDGSKGAKNPAPYRGIGEQMESDIFKIKQSLSADGKVVRGFVLLHIVTPMSAARLPKTYLASHQSLWKRTHQNLEQYRSKGLEGVLEALSGFLDSDLENYALTSSPIAPDRGFLDIICAEVKL